MTQPTLEESGAALSGGETLSEQHEDAPAGFDGATVDGEVLGEPSPPDSAAKRTRTLAVPEAREIVDVAFAVEEWNAYQELVKQLLTPDDYQRIGNRQYKVKSAWRKLGRAFNISCGIVSEEIIRDDAGYPTFARFVVRATDPTGRFQDGDQEAHVTEKCCPASDNLPCAKKSWSGHTCCNEGCNGRVHFTHPGDVPATAHCVPMRGEILTRRGFRRADDLELGEAVAAYDLQKDVLEWVPLEDISYFRDQPTMILRHSGFRAECTPEHSWVESMRRRQHIKSHRTPSRRLRPVTELGAGQLLLAAEEPLGGSCPLTEREAAIWGWILTDGTWRSTWRPEAGPYVRMHIDQSKPQYVAELRKLLGDEATEKRYAPLERTFPGGKTYQLRSTHRFSLSTVLCHQLLDKSSVESVQDWPRIISYLSVSARSAMLDAMLKGDGTRHEQSWVFGNTDSAVFESFQILTLLSGQGLGKLRQEQRNGYRPMFTQTIRRCRFVDLPRLQHEQGEQQDVWCPTTRHGTWVMRLDGQPMITGNTRAKNRAISDLIGAGEVSAEEMTNTEGLTGREAGEQADARRRTQPATAPPIGAPPETSISRPVTAPRPPPQPAQLGGAMTARQSAAIYLMLPKAFPDERERVEWMGRTQPKAVDGTNLKISALNKADASALITELKALTD